MATYYISEQNGNDSRTSTQAQSQSTPWKTTANLNFTWQPGDNILFERGGSYGAAMTSFNSIPMVLYVGDKQGTSGSPINIGAYGSGAQPKLTTLKTAPTPTAHATKTNVYSYTVDVWEELSIVYLDGVLRPVARYPRVGSNVHNGYLINGNFSGGYNSNASMVGSDIPSFSVVGGDIVHKINHYTVTVSKIFDQSLGSSVTYIATGVPDDGGIHGFFFQNHINILSQNGDWAYDRSTGKLYVYWDDAPSNHSVQYASSNYLIWHLSSNYTKFTDVHFIGSNLFGVKIQYSNTQGPVFTNCTFTACANAAIYSLSAHKTSVVNCTFNDCYSKSIDLSGENPNQCIVTGNTVNNNSMVLGAQRTSWEEGDNGSGGRLKNPDSFSRNGGAIAVSGNNCLVQNNKVNYAGYNGITFDGKGTQVKDNYVYMYCSNTMDGGGIYTYGVPTFGSLTSADKRTVSGNICVSALGDPGGTPDLTYHPTYGIYMDDQTTFVDVLNNLCMKAGDAGFYLHHTQNITLSGNTTFDCKKALMSRWGDNNSSALGLNNVVSNNSWVANRPGQFIYDFSIVNNPTFSSMQIPDIAGFSNNRMYIPYLLNDFVIRTDKYDGVNGESQRWHNLSSWQTKFGKDLDSTISPYNGYTASGVVNIMTESFASNALIGSLAGSASFGNRTLSVTNGELALSVSNSSSTARSTFLLYHDNSPVTSGSNYRLRFKAWSTSGSFVVNTYFGNYQNGDKMTQFRVTTTPTQIELIFPNVIGNPYGVGVNFETEDNNGNFYMDDYTIDKVDLTYPDIDADLKVFYNESITTSNVFYLGGPYKNITTGVAIASSPISMTGLAYVVGIAGVGTVDTGGTGSGGGTTPPSSTSTNIGKTGGGGMKRKRTIKTA